jgi:hypothetical protein
VSPLDEGLSGEVLGDLTGMGLGEALVGSGFGVDLAGEVRAGPGPGELWVPSELGGFEVSRAIFLVSGVGGLSTLGDSSPSLKSCVEES